MLGRLGLLALLALAPALALVAMAALTPLPAALEKRNAASTRVLDRHGALLRHARGPQGLLGQPASLADLGPLLPRAIIAAEDARFFAHPGVDPLAVARAAAQNLWHRRVVSGASTLTQQLARTLVPRPRTLRGKLSEMALALRIERSLSKEQILEEYLSRAPFGPQTVGVEAASRSLFDKPARDLSLAEAALVAGLVQGPTRLDPRVFPEAAKRRRDVVLGRMAKAGLCTPGEAERARSEPLSLTRYRPGQPAPHLVQGLLSGAILRATGVAVPSSRPSVVETTLEPSLQREAEAQVAEAVAQLAGRHVTAASAVVIENDTGEILAYVGSPGALDRERLGANDGVLAPRQPGSSLKPFVYELGFERLGWGPHTLVPDIELRLSGEQGEFRPQNYDGRFHGPVRIREALANSYNVPAVWAASALGPPRLLERLRALGMASLSADADHYGAALALGDGEITLLELSAAYATLARGGSYLPPRAVRAIVSDGARVEPPRPDPVRVMDERASALIADVLSDPRARLSAFGEGSALDLPFEAAAKTGTSKGFRDNIAVGFTREVTVAVWVGNFDGSPMHGVSGVTGAGPLFRTLMIAAMAGRTPRPLVDPSLGLVEASICPLSGKRPGPSCPHQRLERFAERAPEESCDMHEHARVDRASGLLAGPRCSEGEVEQRSFERYPPRYEAWAREAGRPLAPRAASPRCPVVPDGTTRSRGERSVRLLAPLDGSVFVLDPGAGAPQAVRVVAEAPSSVASLTLLVDGRPRPWKRPFELTLPLTAGEHTLRVAPPGDGLEGSEAVGFRVE